MQSTYGLLRFPYHPPHSCFGIPGSWLRPRTDSTCCDGVDVLSMMVDHLATQKQSTIRSQSCSVIEHDLSTTQDTKRSVCILLPFNRDLCTLARSALVWSMSRRIASTNQSCSGKLPYRCCDTSARSRYQVGNFCITKIRSSPLVLFH